MLFLQAILQMYTLWITPADCLDFGFDNIITYASVASSFVSISAIAVPLIHDKLQPQNLFLCLFLLVFPKLVLFSWTVSVLRAWSILFFLPIMAINFAFEFRTSSVDDDAYDSLITKLRDTFFTVIRSTLGYNGNGFSHGKQFCNMITSGIILLCFCIPLSMNLNGLDTEDFSNFPNDPFPSRLICFSNASKITQEQQWENLTLPWSPSCNYMFTARMCTADIKEKNRLILILMIALPSVGFGFLICCCYCCFGFLYHVFRVGSDGPDHENKQKRAEKVKRRIEALSN